MMSWLQVDNTLRLRTPQSPEDDEQSTASYKAATDSRQRERFGFFQFSDFSSPESGLHELDVRATSNFHYCGPLVTPQHDQLPPELRQWAEATVSPSSQLLGLLMSFLTFANDFLKANGLQHYWFTVRATKPTHDYDQPRWHTDDLFFHTSNSSAGGRWCNLSVWDRVAVCENTDWKLCTTLYGPSTLFIPKKSQEAAGIVQAKTKRACAKEHTCTSIRCLGCASAADNVRERLADEFRGIENVQAQTGQCAFFRIGPDKGAVHSEPPMKHGSRVFVNLVPGTEEELGMLMNKWGMEFPRAWCT